MSKKLVFLNLFLRSLRSRLILGIIEIEKRQKHALKGLLLQPLTLLMISYPPTLTKCTPPLKVKSWIRHCELIFRKGTMSIPGVLITYLTSNPALNGDSHWPAIAHSNNRVKGHRGLYNLIFNA